MSDLLLVFHAILSASGLEPLSQEGLAPPIAALLAPPIRTALPCPDAADSMSPQPVAPRRLPGTRTLRVSFCTWVRVVGLRSHPLGPALATSSLAPSRWSARGRRSWCRPARADIPRPEGVPTVVPARAVFGALALAVVAEFRPAHPTGGGVAGLRLPGRRPAGWLLPRASGDQGRGWLRLRWPLPALFARPCPVGWPLGHRRLRSRSFRATLALRSRALVVVAEASRCAARLVPR